MKQALFIERDLETLSNLMEIKNNENKMEKFYHVLKNPNFGNFKKLCEKNSFKITLLWSVWIISLIKFSIFLSSKSRPKIKKFKSSLSEKSQKMLSIIETQKTFSFIKNLIVKDPDQTFIFCQTFPYINIEIFLSNEEGKLNIRLLTFILTCLHIFKFQYISQGGFQIYYTKYKFLFEFLSKFSDFPIPMRNNGLPKNVLNLVKPEKVGTLDNWLESKLNFEEFGFFVSNFVTTYTKMKIQHHVVKLKKSMKSKTIRETIHFLKLILFLQSIIPWNDISILENDHNRLFLYNFSQIIFCILSGPIISGRRNNFLVSSNILTSNLIFFLEKIPSENIKILSEIMREKKTTIKSIPFLELMQELLFQTKNQNSKFLKNFVLTKNRSNLKHDGEKGILRSNSIFDTVNKKIGKSKAESTTTQECFLCCGHGLGEFENVLKSPLFSGNEIPFPCTSCQCLKIGLFLVYDIFKNFDNNIENFHLWLKQHNCYHDKENLSYFLKMDLKGNLLPEKIFVNQNNQIELPFLNEKNEIYFKYSDPSSFCLSFLDSGFLYLKNGTKLPLRNLFADKILEYPQFSKTFFPTYDTFIWFNRIMSKHEIKLNLNFGIYSFRGVATHISNFLNVPKYLANSIFGWTAKEGTQLRHYNHDEHLRNDSANQIMFQYHVYTFLLFHDKIKFYSTFQNILKSPDYIKILEKFHPLHKLS